MQGVARTFYIAGYKEVFVKEMPYRLRKFLDEGTLDDVIPRDYVHVFLIRDPVKATVSYLQMGKDMGTIPTGKGLKPICILQGEKVFCQSEGLWTVKKIMGEGT